MFTSALPIDRISEVTKKRLLAQGYNADHYLCYPFFFEWKPPMMEVGGLYMLQNLQKNKTAKHMAIVARSPLFGGDSIQRLQRVTKSPTSKTRHYTDGDVFLCTKVIHGRDSFHREFVVMATDGRTATLLEDSNTTKFKRV